MADFSDPRIARVLAGRRDVLRVPFPGTERDASPVEVGIRILLDDELDDARLEAVRYLKAKKFDVQIDPEILDRAIVREVISRACVDPEKPDRPFFASAEQVRQLDAVLVATFHQHYLDHADEVNPTLRLTEEGADELAERLGKEQGASVLLSSLDAPTLRSLVRTLARRLESSRAGR